MCALFVFVKLVTLTVLLPDSFKIKCHFPLKYQFKFVILQITCDNFINLYLTFKTSIIKLTIKLSIP